MAAPSGFFQIDAAQVCDRYRACASIRARRSRRADLIRRPRSRTGRGFADQPIANTSHAGAMRRDLRAGIDREIALRDRHPWSDARSWRNQSARADRRRSSPSNV